MSKNTGTSELINYFDLGVNGDVGISGSLTLDTGSLNGTSAVFSSAVTASSFIYSGGTFSQFLKADGSLDSNVYALNSALGSYQLTADKGQPNGYASLDGNGKVPLTQINDALIGNVIFQGLWNASTNTPTLVDPPSSGTKGYYYIVSVAGTFAGITFEVGDWIISDGTAWGKVDNTDAVSSVFGRTGNVVASNGDYNTSQVTESGNLYYTDARSRAALSFAAGSGAYNSGTGVITIPTNNNQITNGAGYITSAALSGYLPLTGGTLTGTLQVIANINLLAGGSGSSFDRQISLGSGTAYNYQVKANGDDFQLIEAGSHVFLEYDYGGSLGNGTIRLYNNTVSTASVTATSFIRTGGTSSQYLMADGSVSTLSNPVTGTGTTNYLPKFTGASTIGNSQVFDNGTNVGINTATPATTLEVNGVGLFSGGSLVGNTKNGVYIYDTVIASLAGTSARSLQIQAQTLSIFTGTTYTEKLKVFENGNVVISTSPTDNGAKLQVSGTSTFGGTVNINTESWLQFQGNNVLLADGVNTYLQASGSGQIRFRNNSASNLLTLASTGAATFSSTVAGYGASITNIQDSSQGLLVRATDNDTSLYLLNLQSSNTSTGQTWVDRFAVTKGGNVGIGTASPNSKLEVVDGTGSVFRAVTNGTNIMEIGNYKPTSSGGSGYQQLDIVSSILTFGTGTAGGGSASERMRITSDGIVQIRSSNELRVYRSDNARYGTFYTDNNAVNIAASVDPIAISSPERLQFSTAGTERMRITSGGDVCIGITSALQPAANRGSLSINGVSSSILSFGVGSATKAYLYTGGTTLTIESAGPSADMIFAAGNSDRLKIASNGNLLVGPGSDNGARLQVSGTTSINGGLNTYHQVAIKSNGVLTYQGLGVYSSSNDRWISINHTGTEGFVETENAGSGVMTPLSFKTGGATRMTITSSGNVGIGINPEYLLHIPQNNNLFLSNLFLYGTANNPRLSSGATGGSMSLEGGGGGEARIYLQGAASGGDGFIQFFAGNSERSRITSTGNVLIGTTTSTGAKLEINGDIRTGTLDTGYVSGFWKLGRAVAGTQPGETHQIIVEINGQLYSIGAAQL
jgi:hypothetical protein